MRWALIRIDLRVLIDIMTHGSARGVRVVRYPLPSGCRFVETRVFPDIHDGVYAVIEHESFERVPHGHQLPILPSPIFEDIIPAPPVEGV